MNHLLSSMPFVISTFGWGIIHSAWQSAIVGCALWLVLRSIPNTAARIKYHLNLAALLVIFAWFTGTLFHEWQRLHSYEVTVIEHAQNSEATKTYTVTAVPEKGFIEQVIANNAPQMERIFPWVVGAYSLGVLLMLLRLSLSIRQLFLIRYKRVIAPDETVSRHLNTLAEKMGLDNIKMLYSTYLHTPVMMGFIKPVILLPVTVMSQLSTDQLEAILLHELAHIKRHDYLINILQTFIETIMFFNPVIWIISSSIRKERENCCDDLVLAHTNEPLHYAHALSLLEAGKQAQNNISLAATGKHQHLFNRIKRIMEMKKQSLNYGRVMAAVIVAIVITGSAIWLSPSFAQSKKKDKTESTSTNKIIWIDDKGVKREYNDVTEMPVEMKKKLVETLAASDSSLAIANQAIQIASETLKNVEIPDVSAIVNNALTSVDWSSISADAMKDAEVVMAQAKIEMKNADKEMKRANKEMKQAAEEMKNVDWDQVNKAMKEGMKALDSVDWGAVNADVKRGLEEAKAEMNSAKTKAEIKRAMAEANKETAKAMAEARKELAQVKVEQDRALVQAGKARVETTKDRSLVISGDANVPNIDKMLRLMERDNLIDRNDDFKVEKNENGLYINDEKQPEAVLSKYSSFLGHGKTKIKGKHDNLVIAVTE
jgi:bla regulator protein BlaR1